MIGNEAIRRRHGRHRDIDGVYNSYKLSELSSEPTSTGLSANREHIADSLGTKSTASATNESPRINNETAITQATSSPIIKTTKTWTVDVGDA